MKSLSTAPGLKRAVRTGKHHAVTFAEYRSATVVLALQRPHNRFLGAHHGRPTSDKMPVALPNKYPSITRTRYMNKLGDSQRKRFVKALAPALLILVTGAASAFTYNLPPMAINDGTFCFHVGALNPDNHMRTPMVSAGCMST